MEHMKCLADRLKFKRVIIEDDQYHIWCSSPVWGTDGRVHVLASRIPIELNPETHFGFDHWYATSEIAHYRADRPEGPYEYVRTLLKPGQFPEGSWNTGAQHNPAVTRVGDQYVLVYHSNTCKPGRLTTESFKIGMMSTRDLNGEWIDHGVILSHPALVETANWITEREVPARGVDNPALLAHPNGNFYLYYRARWLGLRNNNSYGAAVASSLFGPYKHQIHRLINNPRYIEDPFVYMDGDIVRLLVTDNHRNKGLLLSSRDPLHVDFDGAAEGFYVLDRYISLDVLTQATNYRHPKLERPQLLMRDGRPTHLFAPGGCNINRGRGTCCYLFEIGD
jgi:hypothetical protein